MTDDTKKRSTRAYLKASFIDVAMLVIAIAALYEGRMGFAITALVVGICGLVLNAVMWARGNFK